MISWLLWGGVAFLAGWIASRRYYTSGERKWLRLDAGTVQGEGRGPGEVASYSYLVRGLGITKRVLWEREEADDA